ncbi:unnamed protein product [Moneuplotes crassus]|uniref:Uncharacterized protein n=1 Tax=Euplotes crassus TaxID=5936 RepID=A0AAD1XNY5_EUPCR|nr:unnamed protein product [Moneuplotes crassus]
MNTNTLKNHNQLEDLIRLKQRDSCEMNGALNKKYLYLRLVTWFRDSHGLFDYDSARYTESDIFIENSYFINRDGNDGIQLAQYNVENEGGDTFRSEYENSKCLASISQISGEYYLFHKADNVASNKEKLWWVIKSFKVNKYGYRGHKLKKGDKIRFGRLVYNVRDTSIDPTNERDMEKKQNFEGNQIIANNAYGQEILGNTEVDLELYQVNGERAAQIVQNVDQPRLEALEDSVNSPRLINHETEIPQNLVTSIANNELRLANMRINTDNNDEIASFNGTNNININNYFENLSTERGNDLMNSNSFAQNAGFINDSQTHLLNDSLDQKVQPQNIASSQAIVKASFEETSSVKSQNCVCKICLSEEEDPEGDPLISPCKCIGTVKYMHVSCLREWIKSKCKISEKDYCTTYIWENLFCELCKIKYPDNVIKKKRIQIVEFEIPDQDEYVLLESFQRHEQKRVRILHVLRMNSDMRRINIGRANKCEARIIDISISRLHSQIRYEKDGFWILDSNSKFGTLIGRDKPSLLQVNEPQYVQVGRSLLIAMVEKPWCRCCIKCLVPTDIQQGASFCTCKEKFPKQCRDIYEESQENLIPVAGNPRNSHRDVLSQKENPKIIPLQEALVSQNRLNEETQDSVIVGPHSKTLAKNRMSNIETAFQDRVDSRMMNSRTRSRYDLTKPIIEHEEEAKGTIEFKNRDTLREESKGRAFASFGHSYRDPLNDSHQPFIREIDEEYKQPPDLDQNMEGALQLLHQMDERPINRGYSSDRRFSVEEEKEPCPVSRDRDSNNMKRSISAQKRILDPSEHVQEQMINPSVDAHAQEYLNKDNI